MVIIWYEGNLSHKVCWNQKCKLFVLQPKGKIQTTPGTGSP